MDYTKLGSTGLDVSRLCLGCMTYGIPDRGNHAWTLNEETSRPILRAAVEAERVCCAFLALDLRRDDDHLVLDVTGPEDARPLIAELFE